MPETTRTLAIETATEACSIALFEDGELVANQHREIGRGHAETLVPMIAALPDKGRARHIVVSLGPGSFTGVRIGIATARALGFAWGASVRGYPTLALVAAIAQTDADEPVSVCMTGGHGEWFVQDFARDCTANSDLASLTPELAAQRPVEPRIAGTKAPELARLHPGTTGHFQLPDARFALHLPPTAFRDSITPIYGRPPDAKPQASSAKTPFSP